MLLQSTWWPSHLGLLASFVLFTIGFLRLASSVELTPPTRRIVRAMAVASGLTAAAMVPHLLAPLSAESIADGQSNALSIFMSVDETLVDAPWAMGVALLAVVAGVAHDLGNRMTAVVGSVGGVSFAAAAVTIPFTDALDGLFAVGGIGITLWTVGVVGVGSWRRRADRPSIGSDNPGARQRLRPRKAA
ncbi:hypothetical protein BH11ACT8_BH11ACT8_00250 [soil metagenome]